MRPDHLIQFLETVHPMPQALKEELHAKLVFTEANRLEYLLKTNQICDCVYFIQSGVVCAYKDTYDHKEDVRWIMQENDVIISVRSYLTQTPSREHVRVLQDAELWSITYKEVLELRKAFPEFNWIYSTLLEHYYIRSDEHDELLKLSTVDRYRWFIKTTPELEKRVSNEILASYLGMSTESLTTAKKSL